MAPQLISCMEIIFKTEQNGGQLLSGRVGLCTAPGAAWHVTVYACFLNKRCWPRWKSAIGHLICITCVIGLYPNTQYIYYPMACRLSCSRGCKHLHRSIRIKKWTVHSKEQTCYSSSWQFFSLHCHLCGSAHYAAHCCRLDLSNIPAQTMWEQTCYVYLQVFENEWAWLKGCFVSTLCWGLLHYWYAIWLPAINK